MDQPTAVEPPKAVRRVAANFSLDLLNGPRPVGIFADEEAKDRAVEQRLAFSRGSLGVRHGEFTLLDV
jgi:hypothetical protein